MKNSDFLNCDIIYFVLKPIALYLFDISVTYCLSVNDVKYGTV